MRRGEARASGGDGGEAGRRGSKPVPPLQTELRRRETAVRRYALLQRLAASDSVSLADYARHTSAHAFTVRKDALYLQDMGLADVGRGQIRRLFGQWDDMPIGKRYRVRRAERMRVARAVVHHIGDLFGSDSVRTILIGSGTVACEVAREMARHMDLQGLTLVTPSLLVVDFLRLSQMRLRVAGGTLVREDAAFQGDDCVAALRSYRPHAVVLGFSGLNGEEGTLYCTQAEEVAMQQTCLEIATRYVYLACETSEKIGRDDDNSFGSVRGLLMDGKEVHLFHPPLRSRDHDRAEYLKSVAAIGHREGLEGVGGFTAHSVSEEGRSRGGDVDTADD